METLYFDPQRPGTLAGKHTFYKHLPASRRPIGAAAKADPFPGWDAYTLHRPISTRKFPRNRTVVYTRDHQWQADFADISQLASKNKGTHFLLTVVDVFSRYAWVRPLKSKKGSEVARAF